MSNHSGFKNVFKPSEKSTASEPDLSVHSSSCSLELKEIFFFLHLCYVTPSFWLVVKYLSIFPSQQILWGLYFIVSRE